MENTSAHFMDHVSIGIDFCKLDGKNRLKYVLEHSAGDFGCFNLIEDNFVRSDLELPSSIWQSHWRFDCQSRKSIIYERVELNNKNIDHHK